MRDNFLFDWDFSFSVSGFLKKEISVLLLIELGDTSECVDALGLMVTDENPV